MSVHSRRTCVLYPQRILSPSYIPTSHWHYRNRITSFFLLYYVVGICVKSSFVSLRMNKSQRQVRKLQQDYLLNNYGNASKFNVIYCLCCITFTVVLYYLSCLCGVYTEKRWFFAHFLQSKLNCEVLSDDLAFEVRWAVAGDSVVIQLVAKLGKYH